MKCPHCGAEITKSDAARALREIQSEERRDASRKNGKKNKKKFNRITLQTSEEFLAEQKLMGASIIPLN